MEMLFSMQIFDKIQVLLKDKYSRNVKNIQMRGWEHALSPLMHGSRVYT